MKIFCSIFMALAVLFFITSCNKKELNEQSQATQGVNFSIAPGKTGGLKSTASTDCFSQTENYVKATIDGKIYAIGVFYIGGSPHTNTIQLSTGVHTLQEFTIWSDQQTPNDSTDDVMLAAAPHSGSTYAPYVASPLNIAFNVVAFEKTQIPIEALCYQPGNYTDFGFIFFQVEEVTLREQPFFGDICIQSIADYSIPGSPYLGQSNGIQPDLPAIFRIDVYRNHILMNSFNNEAWKGEGQPLKVLYADRKGIADTFELKLYVNVRQGAGFNYVYFYTWAFSDAQLIPHGTNGVVDFALGSCFPEADVIIPFSGVYNAAPVAGNVAQGGNAQVGQALTGSYTYSDAEGDLQGTSAYKWYRADDATGTNESVISGASAVTYTLQPVDLNKYIRFAVIPVALTGTLQGIEVKAPAYTGPVLPGAFACGNPVTDTRDGKTYNTVQIGTQCWTKENLNIGIRIDGSQGQTNNGVIEKYCFDNLESNCDQYGGLYQWDEVMQGSATPGVQGICPSGWHVPTDGEFTTLTAFLGGDAVAGGKLKEAGSAHWAAPNTGGTNSSGFTALGAGNTDLNGNFYNLTNYAYFWSSSEQNPGSAFDRDIIYNTEEVSRYNYEKSYAWAVRCVKD